jgi:hypothetical protein
MNTRRFLLVLSLAFLVFAGITGCTIFIDTGASLTVLNDTSYVMDYVSWTDGAGTVHVFGPDRVYDSAQGIYTDGILPGHSETHTVVPGSAHLYFYETDTMTHYRTSELITVNSFENRFFRVNTYTPLNIVP